MSILNFYRHNKFTIYSAYRGFKRNIRKFAEK